MTHEEIESAYRRYGATVLRRAVSILGSEDLAWEVVHEIFLSLLERPDQYGARSSLLTFLYSATTHRCYNRLRDTRVRARLLKGEDFPNASDWHSNPEFQVLLKRHLVALPSERFEVAVYFYLDRMTYDEIAELTQMSRRKVASLLAEVRDTWQKGDLS